MDAADATRERTTPRSQRTECERLFVPRGEAETAAHEMVGVAGRQLQHRPQTSAAVVAACRRQPHIADPAVAVFVVEYADAIVVVTLGLPAARPLFAAPVRPAEPVVPVLDHATVRTHPKTRADGQGVPT